MDEMLAFQEQLRLEEEDRAVSEAVQAVPSATCEFRTGAPEPVKSPIPGIVSGLNTKHVSATDALRKHQGMVATLRMSPADTTLTLSCSVSISSSAPACSSSGSLSS